jgi:predicted transcriptional regulator
MKTAISIPDEVFRDADELATRTGTSRSALYSRAIAEYVDRHSSDSVTAAMDSALLLLDEGIDPFVTEASLSALARSEW